MIDDDIKTLELYLMMHEPEETNIIAVIIRVILEKNK